MGTMQRPELPDFARRLRAIMSLLGMGKIERFAEFLGVPRNVVSNWVNGYNQPRIDDAYRIIKLVPGLTLEWLYLGDAGMVPPVIKTRLDITLEAHEQGLEVPAVAPEPVAPPVPMQRVRRRVGQRETT
jgi:transcriptional regulator with XRE-family HTH domain